MDNIIPYQEVKLENQSVDEIVEDIGILKKIEEASKFEIGRRLVYLKETCKRGEYLPKLEEVGISQQDACDYRNIYIRFGNHVNLRGLGLGKFKTLFRIPNGSEEEYLNKISDPNEVTAKQLREEIEKLKQEKEQEKLAREALIDSNQQLQAQLEKEKGKVEIKEIEVTPKDYYENKQELKTKENELRRKEEELRRKEREIQEQQNKLKEKETELIQREIELNSKEKEIDKREKLVNEKEKELYSVKMQENEVKVQEIIWYEELISTPIGFPIYSLKTDSKPTYHLYFEPTSRCWFNTVKEFDEEISKLKKKYRKMIKYFHPDNKETGDKEKFRIIQESWEVAEDENKEIRENIEDDYDMPF